jgi:hypothetical protein
MLINVGVITHLDHTGAECDARHSPWYPDKDGEEQNDKDKGEQTSIALVSA